jgi:hypothetical protein
LGQVHPWFASNRPPTSEQYSCHVSCLVALPSPRTVDCYLPQSILALSISNLIDSKGSRANCFTGPPSQAHLVLKRSPNPPSSHLCAVAEAVSSAPRKIDGLEGNRGEGRHRRWCWVAMVAIARWFGGHRTWFRWSIGDGWVCCAWKSTVLFYSTSQKMKGPHQPPTLPQRRNL